MIAGLGYMMYRRAGCDVPKIATSDRTGVTGRSGFQSAALQREGLVFFGCCLALPAGHVLEAAGGLAAGPRGGLGHPWCTVVRARRRDCAPSA